MDILKNVNLLLRFVLELSVLISVGFWGFQLKSSWVIKLLSGIGTPIIIAIVWGTFIAPNSAYQLPLLIRLVLECFVFGFGVYALWASGFQNLAKLFAIIVIINIVLLLLWKQ